jgi:hypothetical protein
VFNFEIAAQLTVDTEVREVPKVDFGENK